MDTLVTIHSWVRWLVLIALAGGAAIGFARVRREESFQEGFFSLAVIVVDLQVVIGLVLWIFNEGWDQNAFMAWIHPVLMVLALGVAHMAIARARKSRGVPANRVIGLGFFAAFILVVAGIPWDRLTA